MVTISHLVKKIIRENAFLVEAMGKELISHGNLAENIKTEIENELGKKVKESAIVMALRRYEEELKNFDKSIKKFDFNGDMIMRTNIMEIDIAKSQSLLSKIKNLYGMIDFEKADTLNIVLGNNEVSIITNEKYKDKVFDFLRGEKILNKESNLVALTMVFASRDFINTPGVIFTVVRKLAWEGINIYEIVSTMSELTFILNKNDSMKAYNLLQELINK